MKRMTVSVPELAFVAATRAMAGAGVALLLADNLGRRQRRLVGFALVMVGALTTVPIAREVFLRRRLVDEEPVE
jgi:hypothetical protein